MYEALTNDKRELCAVNDKTVTRYFDNYCIVIIHWLAYHTVEEVYDCLVCLDCLVINCTILPHIRTQCFMFIICGNDDTYGLIT